MRRRRVLLAHDADDLLRSSSISADLLCSRPAVSISSTSAPSAAPASAHRTPARRNRRSARPAITGAPVRSPQICSCSTAAARNVSPATSTGRRPCSRYCCASLPMVVVLPVPLTPTTSTTCGCRGGSIRSGCATGARIARDLLGQRLLDLLVGDLLAEAACGGSSAMTAARLGAEVGARSASPPAPPAPPRRAGAS